ncbi:hypothetical protein DVH24_017865 [Malus domestica]|uniref:Uncharacterized protein n=1 Tax=Malus domestica TaxID=3750 RepID=A0A498KKF8_MALDO|nr:hypothetical protein DVH24_017865 [Malus domestica]
MTSIQEADSLGEKGRQEEETVMTSIQEADSLGGKGEARGRARWEKRKAGAKPSIGGACTGSSRDEELARQLQNQFDLDDYHVQKGDAENIKMSMFSYQKEDDKDYEGR